MGARNCNSSCKGGELSLQVSSDPLPHGQRAVSRPLLCSRFVRQHLMHSFPCRSFPDWLLRSFSVPCPLPPFSLHLSSSAVSDSPSGKGNTLLPTFPQPQLPSVCWVTHSLVRGTLGSETSISSQASLLSPAHCHHLSSVSQPWAESVVQPCTAPSEVGLGGYRILWKVEIWKARAGLVWVLAEITTPHHCDPVSPASVPPRASLSLIFLEGRVSCFLPFPSISFSSSSTPSFPGDSTSQCSPGCAQTEPCEASASRALKLDVPHITFYLKCGSGHTTM